MDCHSFSGIDRTVLSDRAAKLNSEMRKFSLQVSINTLINQAEYGIQKLLHFWIRFQIANDLVILSGEFLIFN